MPDKLNLLETMCGTVIMMGNLFQPESRNLKARCFTAKVCNIDEGGPPSVMFSTPRAGTISEAGGGVVQS